MNSIVSWLSRNPQETNGLLWTAVAISVIPLKYLIRKVKNLDSLPKNQRPSKLIYVNFGFAFFFGLEFYLNIVDKTLKTNIVLNKFNRNSMYLLAYIVFFDFVLSLIVISGTIYSEYRKKRGLGKQ